MRFHFERMLFVVHVSENMLSVTLRGAKGCDRTSYMIDGVGVGKKFLTSKIVVFLVFLLFALCPAVVFVCYQ